MCAASRPTLCRFTPNLDAATTQVGAPGQALFFKGQLYDGVSVRRRGVTAMLWPKPKLKFSLPDQGAPAPVHALRVAHHHCMASGGHATLCA